MKRRGRPDGRAPRGPRPAQELVDAAVVDVAHALEQAATTDALDDEHGDLAWEEVARLAVTATLRAVPGLAAARAGTAPSASLGELDADPAVVVHSGQAGAMIDVTRALILDGLTTMRVDVAATDPALNQREGSVYALQLDGSRAGSRGADRASIVTLFDLDGVVRIVADLLTLAERDGHPAPELFELIGTYLREEGAQP